MNNNGYLERNKPSQAEDCPRQNCKNTWAVHEEAWYMAGRTPSSNRPQHRHSYSYDQFDERLRANPIQKRGHSKYLRG